MSARHAVRLLLLLLAAAGLVAVLAMLADPTRSGPDDFLVFWAGGRLFGTGGNPYDAASLLALERTANWTEAHAYHMRNPPWVLPVVLPFGVLPYRTGRVAWYALHLAAIVIAASVWWRLCGGSARRIGMAWLLPFALAPTMIVWRTGQVTPLVLLGLVLFAAAERRGNDLAAGAALALAAIKPHLVFLLWPALVLWVVAQRRWLTAVGFGLAMLASTAIAVAVSPSILHDFAVGSAADPPHDPTSTVGTVLRLLVRELTGVDYFRLAFVAPAVGLVWLGRHWWRRRAAWRWIDELPLIVLASLALAPFAWVYDEVLAVLALLQIVAMAEQARTPVPRTAIAGLLAFDVTVLAMNVAGVNPFWYVWTAFALLALHAVARRQLAARRIAASPAEARLAEPV